MTCKYILPVLTLWFNYFHLKRECWTLQILNIMPYYTQLGSKKTCICIQTLFYLILKSIYYLYYTQGRKGWRQCTGVSIWANILSWVSSVFLHNDPISCSIQIGPNIYSAKRLDLDSTTSEKVKSMDFKLNNHVLPYINLYSSLRT